MAGVVAQGDQENLSHAYQQAASSKPLNQLRPKTPGNKLGKVTFSDENAIEPQGKTVGKKAGNENLLLTGKKSFKGLSTPSAPKNRAPLGAKTTNAKARPFTTPTRALDQEKPRTGSVGRRQKLKIADSEPAKLDVLQGSEDDVPDIEYMPPPVKDLPDVPEELENGIDMSKLGAINHEELLAQFQNTEGFYGKSSAEKQIEQQKQVDKIVDLEEEAYETYILEKQSVPCAHDPECDTEECKDEPARKLQAKNKYVACTSEIEKKYIATLRNIKGPGISITKGPSTELSKKAASALSIPKQRTIVTTSRPAAKPQASRITTSLLGNSAKGPATIKPSNPSSMRHAAAVAASNTTLGYGRGRAARANLRGGVLESKDANSKNHVVQYKGPTDPFRRAMYGPSPAQYMNMYGEPKFMSEMWWKCKNAGLIKNTEEAERNKEEDATFMALMFAGTDEHDSKQEDAEDEFVLSYE